MSNILKYAQVLVVTCWNLKSENCPINPANPLPYLGRLFLLVAMSVLESPKNKEVFRIGLGEPYKKSRFSGFDSESLKNKVVCRIRPRPEEL